VKITERKLNELVNYDILIGEGIKENPFKISNSNNILKIVYFKNTTSYVHLKDLNLDYVNLKWCKNIIIENCTISRRIRLEYCSNVVIKNCSIKHIYLIFSRAIKFKKNKLPQEDLVNLKKKESIFPYIEMLIIICSILIFFSITYVIDILDLHLFILALILTLTFIITNTKIIPKFLFYKKLKDIPNKFYNNIVSIEKLKKPVVTNTLLRKNLILGYISITLSIFGVILVYSRNISLIGFLILGGVCISLFIIGLMIIILYYFYPDKLRAILRGRLEEKSKIINRKTNNNLE